MPKFLTSDQVEAYNRDGFLAPVDIMPAAEATEIRERLEAAETHWPDALTGRNRNNAHLIFPFLDAVVHDTRILDAVEDLIGPNIRVYGTVLFTKEPESAGFISWHQDGTYMGLEPHDGTTAWLALSPSTETTGCMYMVPGSHTGGIRPHNDTFDDNNILTRGQAIDGIDEADAVPLILKPGQLSFHHRRTIHGSAPNRGADRRIGFAVQSYLPPHVRQITGTAHVQMARGADGPRHHPYAPRPTRVMAPEDVAFRDQLNDAWSDILYAGADKRRDY